MARKVVLWKKIEIYSDTSRTKVVARIEKKTVIRNKNYKRVAEIARSITEGPYEKNGYDSLIKLRIKQLEKALELPRHIIEMIVSYEYPPHNQPDLYFTYNLWMGSHPHYISDRLCYYFAFAKIYPYKDLRFSGEKPEPFTIWLNEDDDFSLENTWHGDDDEITIHPKNLNIYYNIL